MRTPLTAGRSRITLKASHRRLTLKISHRRDPSPTVVTPERERYIAPPKRRR
jgi:hypothetical protein